MKVYLRHRNDEKLINLSAIIGFSLEIYICIFGFFKVSEPCKTGDGLIANCATCLSTDTTKCEGRQSS